MRVYLYQMRPVLFLFYSVETMVNMVLLHFHLDVFSFINTALMGWFDTLTHYFYMIYFYTFTMVTLFASINLCTGNRTSIVVEVVRPFVGFVMYTICSLLALSDAETDLYILYDKSKPEDILLPEKPLHPYFDILRSMAKTSLVASVIHLLHCLISLDVLLSNDDSDDERGEEAEATDEEVQSDYLPVRLYVLGGVVQHWLEQFEWFRDYTGSGFSTI
ncbi:uncharacterized protein LOC108105249 [Drosophila eugracilis]|uniref:uncharacterized protein LOC108105249 n=1 Tax=Drosophila eugracilis TaxID=29029 RepID=UPI001BDA01C6|nr:uncharacterized protein LOC108105249 [Drosophila eugracilis]